MFLVVSLSECMHVLRLFHCHDLYYSIFSVKLSLQGFPPPMWGFCWVHTTSKLVIICMHCVRWWIWLMFDKQCHACQICHTILHQSSGQKDSKSIIGWQCRHEESYQKSRLHSLQEFHLGLMRSTNTIPKLTMHVLSAIIGNKILWQVSQLQEAQPNLWHSRTQVRSLRKTTILCKHTESEYFPIDFKMHVTGNEYNLNTT